MTSPPPGGVSALSEELAAQVMALATPEVASAKARFFRAGPGGYAEGDQFLGVSVPAVRSIARPHRRTVALDVVRDLLDSPWHEVRLLAAVLLAEGCPRRDAAFRDGAAALVLERTDRLGNWDLIDTVAPHVTGPWLVDHPDRRAVLDGLIASPSQWRRRLALVSMLALIRAGEYDETLRLVERVLTDREDLIHKAAGWMLRELGLRDRAALDGFLDAHAAVMPRTMLRYAIEKHEPGRRAHYLGLARAQSS